MAINRGSASMQQLRAPFITSDGASLQQAIVIAPNAAIEQFEPLKAEPHAILDRALDQHAVLVRRLESLRVKLHPIGESATALSCAAADLAVITAGGAIIMRPSDLGRTAELAAVEATLRELQIPILGRIEPAGLLDGGDVLVSEDRIFVGVPYGSGRYARRANSLGRAQFAELVNLPVVEVAVDATYPRLRSVASIVDANTVLVGGNAVHAGAFDGFEVLAMPLGEEYAAGVITLAPRFVLANLRFQDAPHIFRKAKIKVEAFDLWEMGKLGLPPSMLLLALARK